MAVVLLAGATVAWLVWSVRRWRGSEAPVVGLGARVLVPLAVVWTVFTVVRWTPWGAGFAP